MSTLKVNSIQDTGGNNGLSPGQINNGLCRLWVNFNGRNTVSIRRSQNVSSITDHGGGDYTVNFSVNMQSGYVVAIHVREDDSGSGSRSDRVGQPMRYTQPAGSLRIGTFTMAGSLTDNTGIGVAIFGDLA
tara:strand:- start:569 stop:961 length:393 start_codon:yes stop_codon:yes gene_type:complete